MGKRTITYKPGVERKGRVCSKLPVRLKITSWVGTSAIGAQHYYGKLVNGRYTQKCCQKEVAVKHKLSISEAASLNKSYDIRGYSGYDEGGHFAYKPGQLNDHFWTEEAVIEAAKQQWKKDFPTCKVLLHCPRGDGIAQVLDGPAEFMEKGNDIFRRAEEYGWWERGEEPMKPLEAEWKELCKKFNLEMY